MRQEKIDDVIFSLTKYAMDDIKKNRECPIAAFILGTCLINVLSEYRYGKSDGFIAFIIEYLPMYNAVKFKDSFKRRLLRYYSLKGCYYIIGWGDRNKEENLKDNCIHVDDFISNIEAALNRFVEQLKSGELFEVEMVYNSHPIIQDKSNDKIRATKKHH